MRLLLIFVAGLFFLLGLDTITYALQEKISVNTISCILQNKKCAQIGASLNLQNENTISLVLF